MIDYSWHARAACTGRGSDLFFVRRGKVPREAKELCSHCPVREICLSEAIRHDDLGYRGGTSYRERQRTRAT